MAYKGKTTCRILKDIRRQIAEANDIDLVIKECTYQGDCLGTCPKCESEVAFLERELARCQAMGKAVCISGIAASALLSVPAAAQTACETDSLQPNVSEADVKRTRLAGAVSSPIIRGLAPAPKEIVYVMDGKVMTDDVFTVPGDIERITMLMPDGQYAYVVDGKEVSVEEADKITPEQTKEFRFYSQEEASLFFKDVPVGGLVVIRTTDTLHIRGLVKDEQGEPIAGAVIGQKGKQPVTLSNDAGRFELTLPTEEGRPELEIGFIGMRTQTLPAEPLMVITLLNDSDEEFVLTGYMAPAKPQTHGVKLHRRPSRKISKKG